MCAALDPKVIATGFENNGQDQPTAGQVASLTSSNNFINFCLTVPNLPLTNGQQITAGSCNPAPMGVIAAQTNMPSAKFTFPTNGATIQEGAPFTISMAIAHLDTGFFVNAEENYFAAPQQVNSAGDIQGHSHVVVELLSSVTQTTPTDPTKFAFFKGLNDPAANGILTADVTSGLPAGAYRLASINTAANHQPVLVAVAQHGSMDDMVYVRSTFTPPLILSDLLLTSSTSSPTEPRAQGLPIARAPPPLRPQQLPLTRLPLLPRRPPQRPPLPRPARAARAATRAATRATPARAETTLLSPSAVASREATPSESSSALP